MILEKKKTYECVQINRRGASAKAPGLVRK